MKTTFISVLLLVVLAVSSILLSEEPRDTGCDCSALNVTIIACFPIACPGLPPPDTRVTLFDKDCNMVVGQCVVTVSNPCCTLTTNGCSNHTYYAIYNQGMGNCTTAVFTPSGSPHTVTIGCYCP